MAKATIVCKWKWHVNKYQINKHDKTNMCTMCRCGFFGFFGELPNERACRKREYCIAMVASPWTWFASFVGFVRWVVYVVARCAGVIVLLRIICLSTWFVVVNAAVRRSYLLLSISRSKYNICIFNPFIHWYHNHKHTIWSTNMHKLFPEWKLSL